MEIDLSIYRILARMNSRVIVTTSVFLILILTSCTSAQKQVEEKKYHDRKTDQQLTLDVTVDSLLDVLNVNEPVHINQTFSPGGNSEFDCESSDNKVAASCRLACAVAQGFGCGCSNTENGCSCECHGID